MKAHLAIPGANGGLDAQLVDIRETEEHKRSLFAHQKSWPKETGAEQRHAGVCTPELHLMCEVAKLAKKYTRAKRELVSAHAQRALHTPCSAHHSNGTLIDKRNRQKGMLGTRLIHFLCPWWKSLFAAMVREMVSEEG